MTRNTTIDVLRIILAILVVYIHLNGTLYASSSLDGASLVFNDFLATLARMAVPLFFAISGYCLYRNNKKLEHISAKRSIKHLFILTTACLFLYTMINLVLDGPYYTANRFTSGRLYQFLFFNGTGGMFNAPMAWFLLALMMCYLIYCLYPILIRRQKYLILIAVIAYFWALSVSPAYGNIILTKQSSILYRNCLGMGMPLFLLGYFYHKYQSRIHNAIANQTVKFAALAFVLYFIEQVIYLSSGHRRYPMEISILMPMVVLGVLMLATQHPRLLAKTKFPAWSAKYSLYLYIGHTAVLNILSKYLFNNNPPNGIRYYKVLLLYIATIIITLVISWLYVVAKKVIISVTTRSRQRIKSVA